MRSHRDTSSVQQLARPWLRWNFTFLSCFATAARHPLSVRDPSSISWRVDASRTPRVSIYATGVFLTHRLPMADFVSAIVGLIAVGTHVGHKAYRVVAAFKDAQDEFLALSNEITDFRLVLNTVERALADDRIPRVTLAEVDLAEVVRQSHHTFDQVSALLAKLQRQDATEPDVKRPRWAASARNAHTLQKKIRGHKLLPSSISQANTSYVT